MSPEQFLSLLEDRQLLAANHIASLRRQIAESTKEVTAESVAKLLVKKEKLTKLQAKELLKTKSLEASDPSETLVSSGEVPPGPPGEAELRELDDLGLSPNGRRSRCTAAIGRVIRLRTNGGRTCRLRHADV